MDSEKIDKPSGDQLNSNDHKLQVVDISHQLPFLASDEADKTTIIKDTIVLEPICNHELCQKALLVRNVPRSMTEKKLWEYFTKYGRICFARNLCDRQTAKDLGQAHIEFRDADDALKVVSLPKDELCVSGRFLKPCFTCWQKLRPCKEIKQHPVDDENENELDFPCYFDNLPDEVINYIFSFLDYHERIGAERVCKRWQRVNTNSTWIGTQELVFDKIFIKRGSQNLTTKILTQIVKRCGKSLRKINFSSCEHSLRYGFLLEIAKYCPNIESLNLSKTPMKPTELKILMEVCKKLKSLTLKRCARLNDESLSWILKRNNIKYLDLSKTNISGECFHLVKENLETLILNGCSLLTDEAFIHLKNSKLRDLRLDSQIQIASNTLVTLIESLKPTLTNLHLKNEFDHYDPQTFNYGVLFKYCENLRQLHLVNCNLVDDDVIITISNSCSKLSHLSLISCVVSDESICYLRELRHLRYLNLNYITKVSEVSLVKISQNGQLEHLEVRACPLIADEDCVMIMINCPKLRVLDISNCLNITDAFVVELCALEKYGGQKVEVIAGGTGITKFIENNRVKVSERNLCAVDYQPEPWIRNGNVYHYSECDNCAYYYM